MQVLWPWEQVYHDGHDDHGDHDKHDDHAYHDDEDASQRCPYFIDPANNDLTGRVIEENQVKELIVQLHNEVTFVLSLPRW